MSLLRELQPFAIALAFGLLIGIERERSHPPGLQAIGLRTFVLFSLLGVIVASMKQALVTCAFTFFVGAIIVISYLRSTRSKNQTNIGITTELAAMTTYGLGLMASIKPLASLIIGLAVIILLWGKERLHTFSRTRLRDEEFQATLTILILALGILPFLPNTLVDPWLLFNPQRFGILVLIIAIMQFTAYAITRIFSVNKALVLSGLLMGLISSAIATATFVQQIRRQTLSPAAATTAITYATVAMYIKLLIIVAFTSGELLNWISWPVLSSMIIGMMLATRLTKNLKITTELPQPTNPLALWSALKLALLLAFMLIAVTVAQRMFGLNAVKLVAFLGGLIDIHGTAFAIATLNHEAEIGIAPSMQVMIIAIIASFISKIVMIIFSKNWRFILLSAGIQFSMLAAVVGVWLLVI